MPRTLFAAAAAAAVYSTMFAAPLLGLGALAGCERKAEAPRAAPAPSAAEAPAAAPTPAGEPVAPLPTDLSVDMKKVALGRKLYHDARLSGDRTVSCATCHSLDHGGAEPRKTSIGIGGQVGPINSPSTLNAFFNVAQFWNGRAATLAEQAAGPMENPVEMGGAFHDIVRTLEGVEDYRVEFAAVYGESGITKENIVDAIAEYEKSLVTPSRFDAFLRGDAAALTDAEKAGWATFKEVGCVACHQGVGIGGAMFQKLGVYGNYFADRGGPVTDADLGRYTVTQREEDRHVFKVPSLRNVARTPPYLHDGSRETLEETVRLMAKYQLDREVTDDQVAKIVAFLRALDGELPPHARLAEGELPAEVLRPAPPEARPPVDVPSHAAQPTAGG